MTGNQESSQIDALGVAVSVREGCQVVSLSGDLDADTAPRLDFLLDRLAHLMPVVIDLADVRAVTSAGVQALLRERSYGLPTLSIPPGTSVARVLEIVQAHRLVPVYGDLAAALVGSRPDP